MKRRRIVGLVAPALAVLGVLATACSSDGGSDADPTTTTLDGAVTTTIPPRILSLAPNLDLVDGQCYTTLSPATTPETTTSTAGEATDTTADATVPPTLAAATTLIARPDAVAIVDCTGSFDGAVYGTFCLGPHETFADDLTAMACPGALDLDYPGDRTIRRAAARICLQRFEQLFGEPYATSTRTAEEFVPTEALWNRDDRRVVCLASRPAPDPPSSAAPSSAAPGS